MSSDTLSKIFRPWDTTRSCLDNTNTKPNEVPQEKCCNKTSKNKSANIQDDKKSFEIRVPVLPFEHSLPHESYFKNYSYTPNKLESTDKKKVKKRTHKEQIYQISLPSAEIPINPNQDRHLHSANSSKQSCEGSKLISKGSEEIRIPMLPNTYTNEFQSYPEMGDLLMSGLHGDMITNQTMLGYNPAVFDSLALQGYAMEEYARVLTQEHQAKLLSGRKQRPKKYKCPHCNVGFSNNGQLKGHIRIHTGERPFKCEHEKCGKTFTRNEELTRHRRIHSGLRPFACAACGKRFGRKDHLKKHARTHTSHAPRLSAVPVMLPAGLWASGCAPASFVPMFGY